MTTTKTGPAFPVRQFTLNEARALLPALRRITGAAATAARRVETEAQEGGLGAQEAGKAMQGVIQDWAVQVAQMGCVPKGVWLVDFDNGAGYFCWQYGEEELGFFHPYETGFSTRTPIH